MNLPFLRAEQEILVRFKLSFCEYLIIIVAFRENNLISDGKLENRIAGEPRVEWIQKYFGVITATDALSAIKVLEKRSLISRNRKIPSCYSLTRKGKLIGKQIEDKLNSIRGTS